MTDSNQTVTLRLPYMHGRKGTPAEGSTTDLVLEDVPMASLRAAGFVPGAELDHLQTAARLLRESLDAAHDNDGPAIRRMAQEQRDWLKADAAQPPSASGQAEQTDHELRLQALAFLRQLFLYDSRDAETANFAADLNNVLRLMRRAQSAESALAALQADVLRFARETVEPGPEVAAEWTTDEALKAMALEADCEWEQRTAAESALALAQTRVERLKVSRRRWKAAYEERHDEWCDVSRELKQEQASYAERMLATAEAHGKVADELGAARAELERVKSHLARATGVIQGQQEGAEFLKRELETAKVARSESAEVIARLAAATAHLTDEHWKEFARLEQHAETSDSWFVPMHYKTFGAVLAVLQQLRSAAKPSIPLPIHCVSCGGSGQASASGDCVACDGTGRAPVVNGLGAKPSAQEEPSWGKPLNPPSAYPEHRQTSPIPSVAQASAGDSAKAEGEWAPKIGDRVFEVETLKPGEVTYIDDSPYPYLVLFDDHKSWRFTRRSISPLGATVRWRRKAAA